MANFDLPELPAGHLSDQEVIDMLPPLRDRSGADYAAASMQFMLNKPQFTEEDIQRVYPDYINASRTNDSLRQDAAQALGNHVISDMLLETQVTRKNPTPEDRQVAIANSFGDIFSPLAKSFDEQMPKIGYDEYTKPTLNMLSQVNDPATKEAIVQGQMGDLADKLGIDASLWDKFTNMFAPDTVKDVYDLTGKVISPQEAMNVYRDKYLAMSPEDKARAIPWLLTHYLEAADGNKEKAMEWVRATVAPGEKHDIQMRALLNDTPFVFSMTSGLVKGAIRVSAAARTVNLVTAVNPEAGAIINQAAAEGGTAAEQMAGVNQATANLNMTGFPVYDLAAEASQAGVAEKVERAINRQSVVQRAIDAVKDKTGQIAFSLLNDAEKQAAQTTAANDLMKTWKTMAEGKPVVVEAAVPISSDAKGFTLEISAKDTETGVRTIERKRVNFTYDDIAGAKVIPEIGQIRYFFSSPETDIEKVFGGWVTTGTRLLWQQARIGNSLKKLYKEVYRGANKADLAAVDNVLREFEGKVENVPVSDLLARGLTDDQIGMYYANRKANQLAYTIKNNEIYRKLQFSKFAGTRIRAKAVDGTFEADNVISKETTASSVSDRLNGSLSILDDTGAEPRIRTLGKQTGYSEVEQYLNAHPDHTLVEMYRSVRHYDGGTLHEFDLAIVPKNKLTTLKTNPLNYIPGYVTKIREHANYVGVSVGEKFLNGKLQDGYKQVKRVFASKTDAKLWEAAELAKGKRVATFANRELPSILSEKELENVEYGAFGGLGAGHRSEDAILFSSRGVEPEYVTASKALATNLNMVARNMPFNEFKLQAIKRFVNMANSEEFKYLSHNDWSREIPYNGADPKALFLRKTQSWMKNMFAIPTQELKVWKGFMTRFAEGLEKVTIDPKTGLSKYMDGVRSKVFDLGQTSPIGALRGSAFHSLLGFFNPAQFIVQAMSASVAFALDPLRAPLYIRDAIGLRAAQFAMHSDDAVMRIGQALGYKPVEFLEMAKDYERSGLMDAGATFNDTEIARFGGVTPSLLRDIADKGLVFYREGESFGRAYSYGAARGSMARKLGRKYFTETEHAAIESETLRTTFNMTAANKAAFQNGWTSIPLQFQQITFKFFENLAPDLLGGGASKTGKFTGGEKLAIALTQVGLFGAAGVPFFEKYMLPSLVQYSGITPDKLTPGWVSGIKGGMMEYLASQAFGAPVEVGSRLALAGQIGDALDRMTAGDPVWKIGLGASWAPLERTGHAIKTLVDSAASFSHPLEGVSTASEARVEALMAISEFIKIPSMSRNVLTALMWNASHKVYDRNGALILDLSQDPEAISLWAKAFGFQPAILEDLSWTQDAIQKQQDHYKDAINTLRNIEVNKQTAMSTFVDHPDEASRWQRVSDKMKGLVYDAFQPGMESFSVQQQYRQIMRNPQSKANLLRRKNLALMLKDAGTGEDTILEGHLNSNVTPLDEGND